MKKLLVIAALIVSFSNVFAGSTATNAGKAEAVSLIDMTPMRKHHTAANTVNSNTSTIAKPTTTTVNNVAANNMTTAGFSNNPSAIGSTGTTKPNNGVGANISTVANQLLDKNVDAAPNAIIVNYN